MLVAFDNACAKTGLRLNLTKTMLMWNGLLLYASLTPNRMDISECFSYVYLSREANMMKNLARVEREEERDLGSVKK